jgi:hypothetical protein
MQSALQPVLGPKKEDQGFSGRVALVLGGALGIGFSSVRIVLPMLVSC